MVKKLFCKANEVMNKDDISNMFWVASFIAIFTVVCAHIPIPNIYLTKILSTFAGFGVPIFLIRSGYYLNQKEKTKLFWKKKFFNLIVPWIVLSTIAYLNTLLFEKNIGSFSGYLLYILGYNTWIYFIPVLIVCILLHRIFKNRVFAVVFIIISIISNIFDYFEINWLSNALTPYLNVFNRIIFFSIGVLLKNNESIFTNKKMFWSCFIVSLSIFACIMIKEEAIYTLRIPLCLTGVGVILYLSRYVKMNKIIKFISYNTFFIYILHMQFGYGVYGAINSFIKFDSVYSPFFIEPIVAFVSTALLLWGISWICKIPGLRKIKWVIGLR